MIPRPKFRFFKPGRPDNYLKPDTPNKPTEVANLFNGVNVYQPAFLIADNEATFIKNGFGKNGIFQKCPGLIQFGTTLPLDGKIWGLVDYKIANNNEKFLAITSRSVYYLATNDVWTYVTGGENCFTHDADKRVDFQVVYSETVGDYIVICTNYADYVKYYNNTSVANLFTAWKARYTKNYEFFQFYAFIYEGGVDYPQKIYWSDIGKPEAILTGLSGGVVLAKTSDFLTGMAPLGGALFVGKAKSCSLINYTGSYTFPFNLTENIFDVGVACGATMANIGDELLFLGSDKNVYVTDGANKKDISFKVKKLLSDKLNWGKIHRSYGWISLDEKWYFLSIPTTGQDEPNETWVLDVEDWTWQPFQVWDKMISAGIQTTTGIKIGALTEKIGTFTWKIGDLTQFERTKCIGDSDGYVYKYHISYLNNVGSAIDSYVDTKDFVWDSKLIKRVTELILELSGNKNITVWCSTNEGNTWNLVSTISMSTNYAEHFTYPNINCQKIRFRFRCNAVDSFYYLKRFLINKIDKGHVQDVV